MALHKVKKYFFPYIPLYILRFLKEMSV